MKTFEDNIKTATQNMSIIDGLYKAFEVGDIPTVLGMMDSKARFRIVLKN